MYGVKDMFVYITGNAKYKKPIFRLKNVITGKYLTAENQNLVQREETTGKEQQW